MRRTLRLSIPPGQTWPQCEPGAQSTLFAFSWIRVHNRGTARVVYDFSQPARDLLSYWEEVPAGWRSTRNVGGKLGDFADELPTELFVLNTDSVQTANVIVDVADNPIVDHPNSMPSQPGVGPGDILDNTVTASGAIITIPAGRTWYGSLALSAAVVAPVSTAAINGSITVATAGGTATPAAGTVLAQLAISTPATPAGAVASQADSVTVPTLIVAAGASAATLSATLTNLTAGSATAAGYLV